jgi:hypothetical protein
VSFKSPPSCGDVGPPAGNACLSPQGTAHGMAFVVLAIIAGVVKLIEVWNGRGNKIGRHRLYQCTVGKGGFGLAGAGGSFVLGAPGRSACVMRRCPGRARRLTLGVRASFRLNHLSMALRLTMTKKPNVSAKTRCASARTSSSPYEVEPNRHESDGILLAELNCSALDGDG